MRPSIRFVRWLSGLIWFLAWFELYLEVYRHHHVVLSRLGDVIWPDDSAAGPHPGGWVRTVVACSLLAPLVYCALRIWLLFSTAGRPAGTGGRFPIAATLATFGLALCILAGLNQLIRRPPLTFDLTLRSGNGGFLALGAALGVAGIIAQAAVRRRSAQA